MTNLESTELPPSAYGLMAYREGVAARVLRAVGIDNTGEGPKGERVTNVDVALRFGPLIQERSRGFIAALEVAGIDFPDLDRTNGRQTSFRTLLMQRVLGETTQLLAHIKPDQTTV